MAKRRRCKARIVKRNGAGLCEEVLLSCEIWTVFGAGRTSAEDTGESERNGSYSGGFTSPYRTSEDKTPGDMASRIYFIADVTTRQIRKNEVYSYNVVERLLLKSR